MIIPRNIKKILLLGNAQSIHIRRWRMWLESSGIEVTVLTPEPFGKIREIVLPNFMKKRRILPLTAYELYQARRLVKNQIPYHDLLWLHGVFPFNALVGSKWPLPTFIFLYGSDIHFGISRKEKLRRCITSWALRSSDGVLTSSHAVLEQVSVSLPLSVKQSVIPWGVDSNRYRLPSSMERETARLKYGVDKNELLLVSPRHAEEKYKISVLIRAMAGVQRPAKLVVVFGAGDSGYLNELKKLAKKLNLQKRVIWIESFLDDHEMATLFWASDAFFSIPLHDNLSRTILEGMACGSFPILNDIPAYKELKDQGGCVITLLDVTLKSIREAIESIPAAKEFSARNRRAALSFGTVTEAVARTLEFFRVTTLGE